MDGPDVCFKQRNCFTTIELNLYPDYAEYRLSGSRGTNTGAFSNYSQGGATRTNSARGQQSLEGNRAAAGNYGGGNRGGGGARTAAPRGGGGGRRH